MGVLGCSLNVVLLTHDATEPMVPTTPGRIRTKDPGASDRGDADSTYESCGSPYCDRMRRAGAIGAQHPAVDVARRREHYRGPCRPKSRSGRARSART